MSEYPYEFQGKVEEVDFGKFRYTVVYGPKKVALELDLKATPRLRITGEVNEIRIDAAFQPTGGRWYLLLSKKLMKVCGLAVGARATVCFDIADQNAVDLPAELLTALEGDGEAMRIWDGLTPGKKRSMAYWVSSAKRTETREKRIEQVFEVAQAVRHRRLREAGQLYLWFPAQFDPPPNSLSCIDNTCSPFFPRLSLSSSSPSDSRTLVPKTSGRPTSCGSSVKTSISTSGCYGGKNVQTPNVDRLAAEGIRYTNVFLDVTCLRTEPFGIHDRHVPDDDGHAQHAVAP